MTCIEKVRKLDKNGKNFMHWNVAPDVHVLPGSVTFGLATGLTTGDRLCTL